MGFASPQTLWDTATIHVAAIQVAAVAPTRAPMRPTTTATTAARATNTPFATMALTATTAAVATPMSAGSTTATPTKTSRTASAGAQRAPLMHPLWVQRPTCTLEKHRVRHARATAWTTGE